MESTERASAAGAAPSVGDALERAVDAAQGLVGDHIRLLQVEAGSALAARLQRATARVSGVVLLVIAWVLALAATYTAIVPAVGPLHALAGLSALHAVLGIGTLIAARSRGGIHD